MAIYEFYCSNCKELFEVQLNMSDKLNSHQCPNCGSQSERKYTPVGFQFSQGLKELRSSAYIRGTNIKLEDVPRKGLIPAAKRGDKEAQRLLGG